MQVKEGAFLYETHLHTKPVSRCGRFSVRENLLFYKELGYAGVIVTNHFLDGNINIDKNAPYEEKINFYFSDYEEALALSSEIGIDVFCGVESSYKGTDFLILGPDKAWYLAHPEIMTMRRSEMLTLMRESGAFTVQAHPYREASYIDHIRLFPRHVEAVEIYNAGNRDVANQMAEHYATLYDLIPFAGSDNHFSRHAEYLGGMQLPRRAESLDDFISMVRSREAEPFCMKNPLATEVMSW